jgi:hypothetical protein
VDSLQGPERIQHSTPSALKELQPISLIVKEAPILKTRIAFNLPLEDEFKIVSSRTEMQSTGLGPSAADVRRCGKERNPQIMFRYFVCFSCDDFGLRV